jgi:hypothetical protein
MVMLGRKESSEFSPLQFLINNLNSAAYKGVALPFLTELARDEPFAGALWPARHGDEGREDRPGARSGGERRRGKRRPLQKLSGDTDPEVAQEGLRALRNLQARL